MIRPSTLALAFLVISFTAGCDVILDGSSSRSAELRPLFLVVESTVEPGASEVARNQPITLTFSEYLDAASFEFFDAVSLSSGTIFVPTWSRYSMVDKSLTVFPAGDLRASLIYTLALNPETVRSIFGDPQAAPFSLQFQTADASYVEQERGVAPLSFADDIAPVFEAGCSCHYESPDLLQLTHAGLVSQSASQRLDRLLVRPYSAPDSYLMHKLLRDYPDRRLEMMPPPWADDPRPLRSELRRVEQWINTGARP